MAVTRLGLGGPSAAYGAFSGAAEVPVEPEEYFTVPAVDRWFLVRVS